MDGSGKRLTVAASALCNFFAAQDAPSFLSLDSLTRRGGGGGDQYAALKPELVKRLCGEASGPARLEEFIASRCPRIGDGDDRIPAICEGVDILRGDYEFQPAELGELEFTWASPALKTTLNFDTVLRIRRRGGTERAVEPHLVKFNFAYSRSRELSRRQAGAFLHAAQLLVRSTPQYLRLFTGANLFFDTNALLGAAGINACIISFTLDGPRIWVANPHYADACRGQIRLALEKLDGLQTARQALTATPQEHHQPRLPLKFKKPKTFDYFDSVIELGAEDSSARLAPAAASAASRHVALLVSPSRKRLPTRLMLRHGSSEAGYNAIWLGDNSLDSNSRRQVLDEVKRADAVIVEVSDHRQSMGFEIEIALAFDKPLLLVGKTLEHLPELAAGVDVVLYDDDDRGQQVLRSAVAGWLRNLQPRAA